MCKHVNTEYKSTCNIKTVSRETTDLPGSHPEEEPEGTSLAVVRQLHSSWVGQGRGEQIPVLFPSSGKRIKSNKTFFKVVFLFNRHKIEQSAP